MSGVVVLADARDVSQFGSKAVGLGEAVRAGLPLPPGVALAGSVVDSVTRTSPSSMRANSVGPATRRAMPS